MKRLTATEAAKISNESSVFIEKCIDDVLSRIKVLAMDGKRGYEIKLYDDLNYNPMVLKALEDLGFKVFKSYDKILIKW